MMIPPVMMPHKLSSAKSTSCLLNVNGESTGRSFGKENRLKRNEDCSLCWSSSSTTTLASTNIDCCLKRATSTQVNQNNRLILNDINLSGTGTGSVGSNGDGCPTDSFSSSSGSSIFSKCRNIRLRRSDPNQSLGFSIRGGWEHGIGFYVSDVQPDSLAAKQGLCAGDQIVRINGFPLDRVIHDEVVALIRMSANDLTLRVRSTGVVPLKCRPGDRLTWKRLCTVQRSIEAPSSEVSSFVYHRPDDSLDHHLSLNHHNLFLHHHQQQQHAHLQPQHLRHQPSRPRSASSSLTTPSSTISSDDQLSDDQSSITNTSPVNISQTFHPSSNHQPIYYSEQTIFIQCHQPGSSLGCSVVNGPATCPGIFVQNVKPGKLAEKCGLEIGDQIVKVNELDVSMIGFDSAISMLKSMTNINLLVRKGVARHIFECREPFVGGKNLANGSTLDRNNDASLTSRGIVTINGGNNVTECQYLSNNSSPCHAPSQASSVSNDNNGTPITTTATIPALNCHYDDYYRPSGQYNRPSTIQAISNTVMAPGSTMAALNHHGSSPTISVLGATASTEPVNFCTASATSYSSTVQISTSEKNLCCCKRQRLVNTSVVPVEFGACSVIKCAETHLASPSVPGTGSSAATTAVAATAASGLCSSTTLLVNARQQVTTGAATAATNTAIHHHPASVVSIPIMSVPRNGTAPGTVAAAAAAAAVAANTSTATASALLFAANTHQHHHTERLDQVTSAVTNSIRILQEVREKEEKLVEASRKLNEEHQKLCWEKAKFENEKKELNERFSTLNNENNIDSSNQQKMLRNYNASHHFQQSNNNINGLSRSDFDGKHLIKTVQQTSPQQQQYNTISMIGGHSEHTGQAPSTQSIYHQDNVMDHHHHHHHHHQQQQQVQFSFLEEIKAMGENGGKRHLRPVNFNNHHQPSSSSMTTFEQPQRLKIGNEIGDLMDDSNNKNLNRSNHQDGVFQSSSMNNHCYGNDHPGGGSGGSDKNKLHRAPFAALNGGGKDSADLKKRQHELLMQEFRIAHRKMFGKERNGETSAEKITKNNQDDQTDDQQDDNSNNNQVKSDGQNNDDGFHDDDHHYHHHHQQQQHQNGHSGHQGHANNHRHHSNQAQSSQSEPSINSSIDEKQKKKKTNSNQEGRNQVNASSSPSSMLFDEIGEEVGREQQQEKEATGIRLSTNPTTSSKTLNKTTRNILASRQQRGYESNIAKNFKSKPIEIEQHCRTSNINNNGNNGFKYQKNNTNSTAKNHRAFKSRTMASSEEESGEQQQPPSSLPSENVGQQKFEESNKPPPQQTTKNVKERNISLMKSLPTMRTAPMPPPPPPNFPSILQQQKPYSNNNNGLMTTTKTTTVSGSSGTTTPANRITIRVLSPKITS